MDKLTKYAEDILKRELIEAGLEVFQKESGRVGVDFTVKSKSGKSYEMSLQVLNLETRERSIKIHKADWNYELPENLHIGLVLLMKDMEPKVYLIPCKVFEKPDQRIFIENDLGEYFKHLSNWEIRIFRNGIKELSIYGFKSMISQLE